MPRNPSISIYLSRSTWLDCPSLAPAPWFNQVSRSRFSSRIYIYTRFFFLFFSCWSKKRPRRRNRERERSSLIQATKSGRVKGLPVAFRHQKKERINGWTGSPLRRCVRARCVADHECGLTFIQSLRQDLFNSPPRQNGETMTAVHLRSSSSRFLSTSIIPPPPPSPSHADLYRGAGFWSCAQTGRYKFAPPGRFDACLSPLRTHQIGVHC